MTDYQAVQRFLDGIRLKASTGNLSLSEAARLKIFAETTCYVEATLLLIRAAWNDVKSGYFDDWEKLYHEAIQREEECWSNEDMVQILQLAVEIYGRAERDDLARETATKLYGRSPDHWESVLVYLSTWFSLLSGGQITALLARFAKLAPHTGMASYQQAYYLLRLWQRNQIDICRQQAIEYYEEALSLDLDAEHPILAEVARKNLGELKSTWE